MLLTPQRMTSSTWRLRDFKLIAFDMDSTLIDMECVDEIAKAAGKGKEVSAITEAAMQGLITDYSQSLRERVALLKGVSIQVLEDIYQNRLHLNPGAEKLITTCKKHGLKTILVSGGFTFFTDRLRERLQFDAVRSNILEIENNTLTGRIVAQDWGHICDGEQKKNMLEACCKQWDIDLKQTIAMGDGANDIPMMQISGLSVAYHAKPKVSAAAKIAIHEGGLDELLKFVQPDS